MLTESLISLMEPLLIVVLGGDGRLHRDRVVLAAGQADFLAHVASSVGEPETKGGSGGRMRNWECGTRNENGSPVPIAIVFPLPTSPFRIPTSPFRLPH